MTKKDYINLGITIIAFLILFILADLYANSSEDNFNRQGNTLAATSTSIITSDTSVVSPQTSTITSTTTAITTTEKTTATTTVTSKEPPKTTTSTSIVSTKLPLKEPTIEESTEIGNKNWITFNCSAYCCCTICTPGGGITASGTVPLENWTIAASKSYPFGTLIYIEGLGTYCVEDRGGAITNNKLDIYFPTHQEACNFGRQHLNGYVIRWGYGEEVSE